MIRFLLTTLALRLIYEAVDYAFGWLEVPLREPQLTHWQWFWYQVASGYPPGELDHWTDAPVPRFRGGHT